MSTEHLKRYLQYSKDFKPMMKYEGIGLAMPKKLYKINKVEK